MLMWHIWIILGILCFIIEIFTSAFFFASFGIGAFIASIAAFYKLSMTVQICAVSGGTLIIFISIRPLLEIIKSSKADNRRIGVDALIDQKAVVVEPIDRINNKGRIKIRGEEWKASCLDECDLKKGDPVVIKKIEGVTAFVKQNLQKKEEDI